MITKILTLLAVCLLSSGMATAQSFLTYRDVPYDTLMGFDPKLLTMDIYVPRGGRIELPVVLYVHGGGWQGGGKESVDSMAKAFTDSAWVFVSMSYRLAPACPPCDTTSTTAIRAADMAHDVAQAMSFIVNRIGRYNGDGRRICLLGHEAGAVLGLAVATNGMFLDSVSVDHGRLKAICTLAAPIFDVPMAIEQAGGDERRMLLNAYSSNAVAQHQLSAVEHCGEDHRYPAFMLVCADDAVACQRSSVFRDSLAAHQRSITDEPGTAISSDSLLHSIGRTEGHTITIDILRFFRAAVPLTPLSVDDIADERITVHPNPAHDVLMVEGVAERNVITLADVTGRVVSTITATSSIVQMPVHVAAGSYVLRIDDGMRTTVRMIAIN